MNKNRIELERHIIGLAVYGHFGRAAHILTAKNFTAGTPYNHQSIWAAMAKLWPNNTIDLISVSQALRNEKTKYTHYITQECEPLVVNDNIDYFALVLLEMDMREKLLNALTNQQLKAANNKDLDKAALIKDCIELIKDESQDLFQSNSTIEKYLEAYAKDVHQEYTKFSAAIPAKVAQIKEGAQIKGLFNNLYKITTHNNDAHRAQLLVRLASLTKQVLIDADLPHGIDHIFDISPKPEYER